jgi:UDP:flavonoid glycosyltransferase YjiC (YdhE family)
MKCLFTTHPTDGHVQALLPVARALIQAGHEVTFASGARLAERLRASGLRAVSAGHDWTDSRITEAFPEAARRDPLEGIRVVVQDLFAKRLVRPMVKDLVRWIHAERPDIVVHETWEMAGAFAAELCGVPCAVVGTGLNFEMWRPVVAEALAARRTEFGLPPDPDAQFVHGGLVLDYVPPSLHYPNLPQPSRRQPVGRAFLDEGAVATDGPPTLDAPLVYVAAGKVTNRPPGYFESIIDGLEGEQVRVVIAAREGTTGPGDLRLSGLPGNVTVISQSSRSALLQHSAVMISPGGFIGVLAAISHGVPMVTVPAAMDQGQNGVRVAAVGCGLCLPVTERLRDLPGCEALADAPPFSAQTVRASVRRVLSEQAFAIHARKLQLEVLAMPGPTRAVRALEEMAPLGRGAPPPIETVARPAAQSEVT